MHSANPANHSKHQVVFAGMMVIISYQLAPLTDYIYIKWEYLSFKIVQSCSYILTLRLFLFSVSVQALSNNFTLFGKISIEIVMIG